MGADRILPNLIDARHCRRGHVGVPSLENAQRIDAISFPASERVQDRGVTPPFARGLK